MTLVCRKEKYSIGQFYTYNLEFTNVIFDKCLGINLPIFLCVRLNVEIIRDVTSSYRVTNKPTKAFETSPKLLGQTVKGKYGFFSNINKA